MATQYISTIDGMKDQHRREMDEIRAERERVGYNGPPIRAANKHIPPVQQPDIGKMVDIVVRGTGTSPHCKLVGSYGRAIIENQRDFYRDLVAQIKESRQTSQLARSSRHPNHSSQLSTKKR